MKIRNRGRRGAIRAWATLGVTVVVYVEVITPFTAILPGRVGLSAFDDAEHWPPDSYAVWCVSDEFMVTRLSSGDRFVAAATDGVCDTGLGTKLPRVAFVADKRGDSCCAKQLLRTN